MEVADRQTILAPGDRLGCYRIDSFLGQGGFGVTYLARDTMLDLQVAIKEYLPEKIARRVSGNKVLTQGDENGAIFRRGLVNFLKEARTLARFKHPNIVRVMSVFELNGTAYMVMEYERGHDLKVHFNRREHVSEKQLKAIIGPVIDGLDEVHRHGFIHRDIKPANILVRENGSPVLLDFGSARLATGHDNKTMTAMVSVGFAPLEQYSGLDEQQGPWTDVYALGAVLHYAVIGEAPLDSTLRGASVLNDKPDPLRPLANTTHEGYSQSFCEAIDWALQFKVSQRPQTLQQWRKQLFGPEDADSQSAADAAEDPTLDLSASDQPKASQRSSPAQALPSRIADTPTVVKPLPRKRKPGNLTGDGAAKGFEAADTVLMEPAWDMSNVNTPKRSRRKRRVASKRWKGRVLPIAMLLSATLLLVIFKPWNVLTDSGLPERDAVSAKNTSTSPETVLNALGLPATEQQPAPPPEQQPASLPTNQSADVAGVDSDATSAATSASPSARGTAATQTLPDGPILSGRNTPADNVASPDNRASDISEAQRIAARNEMQAEVDRAVQRAESRRMAEFRARLEEERKARQAEEEAEKRRADARAKALATARAQEASRKALEEKEAAQRAIRPLISNSDMVDVLTRFNALSSAIENSNGDAMRQITLQSDRNYAYFDYAFRTFDKIEVKVGNISASRQDQKIRATLSIKRMIRDNGDIAIPPDAFSKIPIYSIKDKESKWSEIHW